MKYPDIRVQLVKHDGNPYVIIGRILAEMRKCGVPEAERIKFREEATSGDYDALILACAKWVDIS